MIASKTSQATVAIAWDVAGVTNGPVTTSVVVSNSALALAILKRDEMALWMRIS